MERSEVSNRTMNGRIRLNWAQTAMLLAETIAKARSEDPYVQVGACAIKSDKTIVLGYNGAPPGIDIDWSDRDKRRPYILHAESNLLDLTKPGEIDLMAVTHIPCPECLKRIAKYSVREVFYKSTDYQMVDLNATYEMASKLNINLTKI